MIAPYWNWRIEVNKTHNSLGKLSYTTDIA